MRMRMKLKLPAARPLPVPQREGVDDPEALVDRGALADREGLVETGRPSLRVHRGGITEAPDAERTSGTWPLHSAGTFATSLLVVTAAVGWMVTVAALTAPAMATGEVLARVARLSEGA